MLNGRRWGRTSPTAATALARRSIEACEVSKTEIVLTGERTGVAVACYRMAVEHWPLEKALSEAKNMGLHMPNEVHFLERFSKHLQKGKIEGYTAQ